MRRAVGQALRRGGGRVASVAVATLIAIAGAPDRGVALQSSPPAPGVGPSAGPPPGSELRIYVMTMGVGAEVWERFGHNAIIVEDRLAGTSTAYNYGMFSFRQESFLLRFIQGRMLYWMGNGPAEEEVPRYIALERSVWRQELNLTPAERASLRDALLVNARPENVYYRYDYYRDNCSTRVRDMIDRVLHGALSAQTQTPADGNYRFHTQRLNANSPLLYTGLLLAEGEGADAPNTRWEEMFLPLKLREHLRDIRVPDGTGAMVPLVVREDTLYLSDAFPVPDAPPDWRLGYLALGTVLGGLLWWGGKSGRSVPWGRRSLLLLGTTWAALTGFAGLILEGLWVATDHAIAARNENVLQLTVLALALGICLPLALRDRAGPAKAARLLAVAVAALSLLGLLLKLVPGFDQMNGQVLALTVPANLGLALGVLAWTRSTPR